MIAYKFRSACPPEYVKDIIENNRLFCASKDSLNDPWEGTFGTYILASTSAADAAQRHVQILMKELRVCALSESVDNVLTWAYYASGFSGFAIEVEIPEPQTYHPNRAEGLIRVRRIRYEDGNHLGLLPSDDPEAASYEALAGKLPKWQHEDEVRIIAHTTALSNDHFPLAAPVQRVIVAKPETWRQFHAICEARGIPMAAAIPKTHGLEIVPLDRSGRPVSA